MMNFPGGFYRVKSYDMASKESKKKHDEKKNDNLPNGNDVFDWDIRVGSSLFV